MMSYPVRCRTRVLGSHCTPPQLLVPLARTLSPMNNVQVSLTNSLTSVPTHIYSHLQHHGKPCIMFFVGVCNIIITCASSSLMSLDSITLE